MSKIQIAELQKANSEFNDLNDREVAQIVGGGYNVNFGGINVNTTVQVNTPVIVQVAFKGSNYAYSYSNNNNGTNQG
jgi:hypothetical protein